MLLYANRSSKQVTKQEEYYLIVPNQKIQDCVYLMLHLNQRDTSSEFDLCTDAIASDGL